MTQALRRDERVDTAEVVIHRILKTGRGAGGQTVRKREGQGFPGGVGDVPGGRKRKEQRRKPYERTRREFKEAFTSVAFARGSCETDGFDGDRFRTLFRQSPAKPLGFEKKQAYFALFVGPSGRNVPAAVKNRPILRMGLAPIKSIHYKHKKPLCPSDCPLCFGYEKAPAGLSTGAYLYS